MQETTYFSETWNGTPNITAQESGEAVPASPAAEARLQEVIDAAVRKAIAETLEPAERPLHELSTDEFRSSAAAAWAERAQGFGSPTWNQRRPMTIGELIAGRYEDDGAV